MSNSLTPQLQNQALPRALGRRQFLGLAAAAMMLGAAQLVLPWSSATAAGSNAVRFAVGTTFPGTAVLDNFNRGSLTLSPMGPNWAGSTGSFRIVGRAVQVVSSGFIYWKAASFGADQEAYFTFTKVEPGAHQNLLLKRRGRTVGDTSAGDSFIDVKYEAENSRITINTFAPYPQYWVLQASLDNVAMAPGDQFGARAYSDGTVEAYKNGALILTHNVTTGPNPWSSAYASGGGQIGVWFNAEAGNFVPPNDADFDDYGGGSL